MTKRKAIQAAMERLRAEAEARSVRDGKYCVRYEGSPLPGSVEAEIDRAYKLGRIAGLREAANLADIASPFPSPYIRNRANELAKKARTK